jgi:hypothetical protein
MSIKRIGKHLLQHRWRVRRIFPPQALAEIERAIKAGEQTHSGQVRFAVEGALDGKPLFKNQPARERALDIFSQRRVISPAASSRELRRSRSNWRRTFRNTAPGRMSFRISRW